MPIYEYRCGSCGETFEYMQRISDAPKTTCESCGGALERLISQSAFVLKGGGWYKDLYSTPKAKADGDSKPKEKKGEAGESASTSKKESGGAGSGAGSKGSDG